MNRCQGLPEGPCPEECCDAFIKYGIYDLFLCKSCAETRDAMQDTVHDTMPKKIVVREAKPPKKPAKSKDLTPEAPGEISKMRTRGANLSNKNANGNNNHVISTPPLGDGKPNKQVSSNKEAAGDQSDDNSDIDGSDCCHHCLIQLSGKRQLRCDICSSSYHQKCTQMNSKVFDKFITNVADIGWVCSDCKQTARSTFHRLETAISQLAEELAAVKSEMSSVKCELLNIKSSSSSSMPRAEQREPGHGDGTEEARTTLIIHRTLNDAARRKRNVIVSGFPESNTRDDRSEFIRMCEENFTIKPAISDNACTRIGKQLPHVPRRLLVRLNSEDTTAAVLKDAHRLRSSVDHNKVYINPDLSPAAAAMAYEARKKRRESKLKRTSHGRDTTRAGDDEDEDEVNLPFVVTRSSSSRSAASVKAGSTDQSLVTGLTTTTATAAVQSLSSSPKYNLQPNNLDTSATQSVFSFRPGPACNQ